jgi:hypothetical protein
MIESMAKSPRGKPVYSLSALLGAQGPGVRNDPRFAGLESMLRASPRLAAVRLGRRAYALLDESRLGIENLPDFFATYRIPPGPFFRLFLTIKRDRRARLDGLRRDRDRRIADIAATFPKGPRLLIDHLAAVERLRNPEAPLWRAELRPNSLKRAREMEAFGLSEWIECLAGYIERLRGAYRRLPPLEAEALIACMILECMPDPATGRLPSKATARAQFKRLSKACHPDLGGDARRFLLVSRARDELVGRRP